MTRISAVILLVALALIAVGPRTFAQDQRDRDPAPATLTVQPGQMIDLVIALDTSSSMEHLLEAARLKLWEIVYDLSTAQPTPKVRVALLTYGSNDNSPASGWVKIEVDLTDDLDLVGERLFELSTAGGYEYVGRVVQAALDGVSWADSDEALKLLFVVGNEPADQDRSVSLYEMSDLVAEKGISLHLVFCGTANGADAESWVNLASLSQGRFAVMDHRTAPVSISTPFDEQLAGLSTQMNQTYLPLGAEGQERVERMAAWEERLDDISASTAASRAVMVSNPVYSSSWDLVDASASGAVDLYELDESLLPDVMQPMSIREREIYLEDMQARRDGLRQRIAELGEQRRRFVAQEIKRQNLDTSLAFDSVVKKALRDELEERDF